MIAKATTHGQLFCATGGTHLTSNDMLTAFESKNREEDIKKLQQSKKEQQFLEKCVVEENEILANNKPVAELSVVELEELLLMHQIPKAKKGNKNDKLVKWKEILLSKKIPSSFDI